MKAVCIAVMLCALLPVVAQAGSGVRIELLPDVRVASGSVVLGQVAHLSSGDLNVMRALVNLPIGSAPPLGESVTVDREALAGWIQRRAGVMPSRLEWAGPAVARVSASSRVVAANEIAAAAEKPLRDWLAAHSDRYQLDVDSPPSDVSAPDGQIRMEARPIAATQAHRRMVVWVDIWASQRFIRTVPVAFTVTAWGPATVASAALAADAPLSPTVAETREVELTQQRGTPAQLRDDGSLRTRRALHQGQVIGPADLQRAPEVLRGHWATLRSEVGPVRLESRVEILQDGWQGDSVRVRVPGAVGLVMARVTGAGQLEVNQ